jgi:hypothetical protein
VCRQMCTGGIASAQRHGKGAHDLKARAPCGVSYRSDAGWHLLPGSMCCCGGWGSGDLYCSSGSVLEYLLTCFAKAYNKHTGKLACLEATSTVEHILWMPT